MESQRRGNTRSAEVYQQRRDRFAEQERRLAVVDKRLTHARLAAFVVSVLLFAVAYLSEGGREWYLAGGVALSGFVALVFYHESISEQLYCSRDLRQINEERLARLWRQWDCLSPHDIDVPTAHRELALDLDVFGRASLFQWLCVADTPLGMQVLRDWLLEPTRSEETCLRQQAATELAPLVELRENLNLEGRRLRHSTTGSHRFISWAEGDSWLAGRRWLRWTSWLLPAFALGTLGLTFANLLSPDVGGGIVFGVMLGNMAISVLFSGNAHDIFDTVTTHSGEVRRYLRMFEMMQSMPESTSKLHDIKRQTSMLGGGVLRRLGELNRVMMFANIRHSSWLAVLVYVPLQVLLLWDFHVLALLERWQQRYGRHARPWFVALAEFEALACFARVKHDHPDWAFAVIDETADRLSAQDLGHPLLPDDARVTNDAEVGPAGTFVLVTGSNMSGKSTLLRAIGVNVLLGQAGAPVCATRLALPPVRVITSMRVQDSLSDGVSFFMAELMRLKKVVDESSSFFQRRDRELLYLLDEILQGTNSRERHIAVVRVLSHLVRQRAIGAVSTHDLELATSDELAASCQPVHFRETLHRTGGKAVMTFDYLLRPGVATTSNALKLLEIVGLENPVRRP